MTVMTIRCSTHKAVYLRAYVFIHRHLCTHRERERDIYIKIHTHIPKCMYADVLNACRPCKYFQSEMAQPSVSSALVSRLPGAMPSSP